MRKFIIVAIVLVVIGVGVSFFLIPSKEDVAVLQARDQATVELGNIDVEAEYTAGRRTFPIISGLADKRVAEGNRPAAVTLLEEYVAANPNDVQGRKKLAEQYQLSGENAKYNEQLETIAAAEPTEANLRVLSDIYNADKNYPKQVEVLKKIVEVTQGSNPQTYVDLATIQVVTGDKDGAMKTVEELKAKHPTFESYAVVRIQVNILAEKGQIDEAYQMAKSWVDRPLPAMDNAGQVPPQAIPPQAGVASPANPASERARELADLANILHYSGHADKAVELIEPHLALLEQSTELVVAYVNANITLGRDDHAYELLAKIDEAGKMVPELYHPYLQLAIKREDMEAADGIASRMDVAAFNEEQALNIIELARSMDAQSTLDILLTRFSEPTILENKPVLTAVISILKNEKDQDAKIEVALNTELTSVQRLRLAEACARADKMQCFDAIVARFPPVPDQTSQQIAEYAQLYIIADRPKEVIEPVGVRATVPDAHPDVVFAHVSLAAASGRDDITKPWLEQNANNVPMVKLQGLYYTAADHGQTAVASDIAERLYARDPSPMNRDIMIAAFIRAGQHDKALPLLREQLAQDGSNDGLYLSTLTKVARKDSAARKELADYAQAALQSGRGDERQQINYAYIMLNNGRRAEAMPYIKDNASTKGGEWRKMYAQLTTKASSKTGAPARKLSREERIAMANNPSISTANKRQIAFGLMNDGYKADATKIFADLAKDKGPESQEVKDLLYMWGGKLNAEQMAWVQTRAANASPYDKEKWGEIINQYGDDAAVMQYVATTPDALYNRSLRQKYFRIIAASGNRDNFDTRMRDWVNQTTDVPALSDYASTAQAYGYTDAAANAYERVLTLDPTNEQALNQMTALSFSKGNYRSADGYVNRYLSTPQATTNPSQAHFYKALLLKRQGQAAAAQQEFANVVNTTNESTPDALSRLYTAQFNLGQHAEAKRGFEALLATYPDDKALLADYMSALIEYKYFDDATRVANQYDKNSPYYGRSAALQGQSMNVSSIQRLSGGREMKIAFNAPIEDKAPIDLAEVQKLAWVEHAELGYDSMTVSAKPGYVVRYVPTASEQFQVVAAPVSYVSPQVEQQRQQDLRLQLLYARIENETGQSERARQRLAALQQYYPNDTQLITYQANVEATSGNTSRALELLQQAQALQPENEELAGAMRGLRQVNSKEFVKLDHEYRNYGSIHEQITTLSGVKAFGGNNEIGATYMTDAVNYKALIDPQQGDSVVTGSERKHAGELFLAHYFDSGNRMQGSLFVDENTAGLGAYYAFTNALGRTELLAEYHKPYWDFGEAVYHEANRDRVGYRHYTTLNSGKTGLGLEGSLNNYNIASDDNVAQTVLARLSLVHELQAQTDSQPYYGVGYGFDGEYLTDRTHRRQFLGTGTWYRPFPFQSREVHQLTGIYRDDWTDSTHALLQAGYAWDRLNDHGPVAEGRITQDLTDQLEAGVRARYGIQTSVDNASTEDKDAINLGAHLMYKF